MRVCPPALSLGRIWHPALWVAFVKSVRKVEGVKKKKKIAERVNLWLV